MIYRLPQKPAFQNPTSFFWRVGERIGPKRRTGAGQYQADLVSIPFVIEGSLRKAA